MPDVDVAVVDAEMSITMTMIFRSCPPWAEHKSLLGSVPFWTRARHNVRTEANANANDIGSSSPGIFILDDLRRRHRDNPAAAAGRDECLQGANSSGSRCVAITWTTTSITYSLPLSLSLSLAVSFSQWMPANASIEAMNWRREWTTASLPASVWLATKMAPYLSRGESGQGHTHTYTHTFIHTKKEAHTVTNRARINIWNVSHW